MAVNSPQSDRSRLSPASSLHSRPISLFRSECTPKTPVRINVTGRGPTLCDSWADGVTGAGLEFASMAPGMASFATGFAVMRGWVTGDRSANDPATPPPDGGVDIEAVGTILKHHHSSPSPTTKQSPSLPFHVVVLIPPPKQLPSSPPRRARALGGRRPRPGQPSRHRGTTLTARTGVLPLPTTPTATTVTVTLICWRFGPDRQTHNPRDMHCQVRARMRQGHYILNGVINRAGGRTLIEIGGRRAMGLVKLWGRRLAFHGA